MIRSLGFAPVSAAVNGRRVRRSRFEPQSALPVSAACVVANGIREVLSSALAQPVRVRLTEPVIPDLNAWNAILAGMHVYRVRGPLSDAAIVLRREDSLALAGAVFGESVPVDRALSPIEERVLARIAREIAAALSPVCGAAEYINVEKNAVPGAFLTYFELLVDGPMDARIGIALAREPQAPCGSGLGIAGLSEVELELDVEFASGEVEAASLLLLQPNMTLAMQTKVGAPAVLKLAGRIVARGECGVLGERRAFVVNGNPKGGKF